MSTNAKPTTSAGLTDAERAMLLDGQEHTVEAACWSASCAGSLPWAVARIKADAIAAARAEERARLTAVLTPYFDFDVDPWKDHDSACPAPEDMWRLHRDLRAALKVADQ